jgi:hypothetical protein
LVGVRIAMQSNEKLGLTDYMWWSGFAKSYGH